MLFADAASAAERSVLETDPPVTWASAGAIRPPTRPLAKFSAPIRNSSVMKLNASVNGGTFQAPMNTLASAACRTVEKNAPTTIQTITSASQSGCRNSDIPAPTSTPLKPNSPARIAPRSIPISDRRQRRDDEAERAGEAEPGLGDEHRHQDREPGDRVVHEADLPDAAQAGVDEGEQRVASARSAHAGIVPLIDRPAARRRPRCSSVCLPHWTRSPAHESPATRRVQGAAAALSPRRRRHRLPASLRVRIPGFGAASRRVTIRAGDPEARRS